MQDAPRPALARIHGLIGRLDDTQLDQAYALLGAHFGLATARGREHSPPSLARFGGETSPDHCSMRFKRSAAPTKRPI